MDDDNDVLDWGNEEDDQKNQDYNGGANRSAGDIDDAEDAVSLGEEEDEQQYYTQQQGVSSATAATESDQSTAAQPSNEGDTQRPSPSRDLKRQDSSTSQLQSSTAGSPRRNSSATSIRSPQRPQTTRLTHALPPKPVVTNVPFLHPSHPSIVEATAMSVTTRSTRSESHKSEINGRSAPTVSTTGTGKSSAAVDPDPLPNHWEPREARSGPGGVYYYNVRTKESTWTRPVSSSNSSRSRSHSRSDNTRRHRGSNLPAGYQNLSPPRSDQPHPRSQETSRHPRRAQPSPDPDMIDLLEAPAVPDANGLSYKDRHYRPGGAEVPVPLAESRRADRSRDGAVDPRFNPHPDLAFTPPASPARVRERARSLSPFPVATSASSRGREPRSSRAPRSGRGGRDANTDADSSMQRDRDVLSATLAPPRSHRSEDYLNPALNSSVHQESRRRPRHQDEAAHDAPAFEGRPPMPPRNGSIRGRNRDRDQPRAVDLREQNRIQNIPSSRIRSSPPRKRDHRTRDEPSDLPPPREPEQPRAIPARPVSPSTSVPQPPSQRKRERPTRFGQPSASISPVLTPSNISVPRSLAVEPQTYPRPPIEDDDPFLPDDIRSPSPQESHARRDVGGVRDELTIPSALQQIARADVDTPSSVHYSNKQAKPSDDRDTDMDRVPLFQMSSKQVTRPKRAPLPPQEAEFRDQGWERIHHPSQDRRPSRPALNDLDGPSPAGPRDQQRSNANPSNVPSGPRHPYSQSRGDGERAYATTSGRYTDIDRDSYRDRDRDMRRGSDKRPSTLYPPSLPSAQNEMLMDVDGDGLPPRPTRRRSSPIPMRLRIPEVESAGPEYGGEDAPPRGPRAMSGSKPIPTATQPHMPTSPVMPFAYAQDPSNRHMNRSPPPHLGGNTRDGAREREFDMRSRRDRPSEWTEQRGNYPSDRGGRRDTRGRSDFHRMASGANHVPIGNHRKGMGNVGAPHSGARNISNAGPPPGMGGMSSRQTRGGSIRGRGGGPPYSHREMYEREPYHNDDGDTYQSGRAEGNELHSRRRDASPPPFEKHQSLGVNTAVPSVPGPFSGSPQASHLDPASAQDPSKLSARTWTPRGASPPREAFRPSVSPTPPPTTREPSNVSPSWESTAIGRPPAHYPDSRVHERPGSSRGAPGPPETRPTRPGPDEQPPRGRDRHAGDGDANQRSRSLEGRLGDRYEEPFDPSVRPPPIRQPHALPPNPALHRDHPKSRSPDLNRRLSDRRPMRSDHVSSAWVESARRSTATLRSDFHGQRTNDDQVPSDGLMSRSSRPRKYQSNYPPQDEHMGMSVDLDNELRHMHFHEHDSSYSQHRPEMPRRGGSLLDRMALDENGDDVRDDLLSLRDRVQVPAKRDREDMIGDRYGVEDSFDGDEGDPAAKKMRRKSVKPRKPNRKS